MAKRDTNRRQRIREEAIKLIEAASTQGIRYAELERKLCETFPEIPRNTVQGALNHLRHHLPDNIEQPQRGLYRTGAGPGQEPEQKAEKAPLAAWLNEALAKNVWNVPRLAKEANIGSAAIYRILSGVVRNPRPATRKRLEDALGRPIPPETKKEVTDEAMVEGLGEMQDFEPHIKDDWPDEAGIYVLYDISDRPIYVGQGSTVRTRLQDHHDKFWFREPIVQSASWIPIKEERLRRQIERVLIKFLKSNAVLNKQLVER